MPEPTPTPDYWQPPPPPPPRGIPLPPDNKFQKPLMKAIKAHIKPNKLRIQRPKKREVKWW